MRSALFGRTPKSTQTTNHQLKDRKTEILSRGVAGWRYCVCWRPTSVEHSSVWMILVTYCCLFYNRLCSLERSMERCTMADAVLEKTPLWIHFEIQSVPTAMPGDCSARWMLLWNTRKILRAPANASTVALCLVHFAISKAALSKLPVTAAPTVHSSDRSSDFY